jgi:endonuclease/exonuclease/phosphatase family metal-dependent hydrolase
MPYYNDLRPKSDLDTREFGLVFPKMSKTEKLRTIEGIVELRKGLEAHVPQRRTEKNLVVASWNIKEFGHTTQRLPEAYYYAAEIIAAFDLVAIQEIKSTTKALERIMRILGKDWDFLINDITDGASGNSERSAYVYNTRRVRFSGLAGELVLPDKLSAASEIKQFVRTPYITGFTAGWKSFVVLCLHLSPNKTGPKAKARAQEVTLLTAALAAKTKEAWENIILTGDFNLYNSIDQASISVFKDAGYLEVKGLEGTLTNAAQTEAYDRFFIKRGKYFSLVKKDGIESGGVFKLYDYVYRDDQERSYQTAVIEAYEAGTGTNDVRNDHEFRRKYYQGTWRRNQMSDHLPIWFELETDSSVSFLESNATKIAAE